MRYLDPNSPTFEITLPREAPPRGRRDFLPTPQRGFFKPSKSRKANRIAKQSRRRNWKPKTRAR